MKTTQSTLGEGRLVGKNLEAKRPPKESMVEAPKSQTRLVAKELDRRARR